MDMHTGLRSRHEGTLSTGASLMDERSSASFEINRAAEFGLALFTIFPKLAPSFIAILPFCNPALWLCHHVNLLLRLQLARFAVG